MVDFGLEDGDEAWFAEFLVVFGAHDLRAVYGADCAGCWGHGWLRVVVVGMGIVVGIFGGGVVAGRWRAIHGG